VDAGNRVPCACFARLLCASFFGTRKNHLRLAKTTAGALGRRRAPALTVTYHVILTAPLPLRGAQGKFVKEGLIT
jgi:hypothetical protein